MRIEDFAVPRVGELAVTGTADLPFVREPVPEAPAKWVLPIEHFSASSMNMAAICPRQWQQRYIHNRKEAPGQKLVLGSLTHGGIEFGLQQKILTQADPDLNLTVSYYHDAVWPNVIDRYGGQGEIIWEDRPESVRDKGAQLVSIYHPRITMLEPEDTEQEFLVDVGLPVPIKGYVDCVQQHGRSSIDFKTTGQRQNELKPDWRMQARVYQLAIPRPVDFHQITTTKTPEVITPLETEAMTQSHSPALAEQTLRRMAQTLHELNYLYATLGPDEDWPMRGIHHPWRCSPRWCAYRKDCPVWLA